MARLAGAPALHVKNKKPGAINSGLSFLRVAQSLNAYGLNAYDQSHGHVKTHGSAHASDRVNDRGND